MSFQSSRRSRTTGIRGGPIPDVVPILVSNPPAVSQVTQTNQQTTHMEFDEESVHSTGPMQMTIPKLLPTIASFWAWTETEFQPFYSDALNDIMMVQMGIISFQKMVTFFAHTPHQEMLQVLGKDKHNFHQQSLIDLAIIWEFAQALLSSGDDMISPTHGDFITFQ